MDLKRTMIFVRLTGEGKASFGGPLLSTSRLFGPSMTQQKRCGFSPPILRLICQLIAKYNQTFSKYFNCN